MPLYVTLRLNYSYQEKHTTIYTTYFEMNTEPIYVIPGRTEMMIECHVTNPELKEGLNLTTTLNDYPKLLFSKCLTRVKSNNKINVSVLNTSQSEIVLKPIKLTLEPVSLILENGHIESQNIAEETVPCFPTTLADLDHDKRVQSALRCDHLNSEEESSLRKLCSEFNDIFYLEGDVLTATKTIQHEIRTTSEHLFMSKAIVFLNATRKK